jgi:hypothetical protein
MKLIHLTIATAAAALLGGAAYAQEPTPPGAGSAPADSTTSAQPLPEDPTVPANSTTEAAPAAPAPAATTTATDASTGATLTNMTVTNGPVPDTAENRAKYGQPMSRAGKRTAARGN